jgi:hypothetical protein
MTTHNTNARRDGGCRPGDCLRRYATPPAPPLRDGLTVRQSGELERIEARYGALRWRLRDNGTVAVAVLGDHPEPDDEVLLMLMRGDGTLLGLSHWAQARDHLTSASGSGRRSLHIATEGSPHATPWSSPADHAGAPATTHARPQGPDDG